MWANSTLISLQDSKLVFEETNLKVRPVLRKPKPHGRCPEKLSECEARRSGDEREELLGDNVAVRFISPFCSPKFGEEVHLTQANDNVERWWQEDPPARGVTRSR